MLMTKDDWERLRWAVSGIVDAPKDRNPSIMREVAWELFREEFGHYEDAYALGRLALAGRALAHAVESALGSEPFADTQVIRALAAWKELAGPTPATPQRGDDA